MTSDGQKAADAEAAALQALQDVATAADAPWATRVSAARAILEHIRPPVAQAPTRAARRPSVRPERSPEQLRQALAIVQAKKANPDTGAT